MKGAEMSIRNNIKTVVVEILNVETGDRLTPVYEAYGAEGFQKFVDFYASNSGAVVAWVKGYDYNDEHGNPRLCASVFVNIKGEVFDLAPEPELTSAI
jgi:hypothetical protein